MKEILKDLAKNKCIVFLAMLGDPTVTVGKPGTGGFNQTVKELVEHFKNTTTRIIVITNKNQYSNKEYLSLSPNISVYFVDFDTHWEDNQNLLVQNLDKLINNVCQIIKLIGEHLDVCLIHSFYWLSGIIAANLKNIFNIPFIHTVISLAENKISVGVRPHASEQRAIESEFFIKAELVLAITPQEKQILIDSYNINGTKIIVVGRSVNKEFFNAYNDNKMLQNCDASNEFAEVFTDNSWWLNGAFLYVGRITQTKGIEQIIKAWSFAKKEYELNIPLWLVGGTPHQISDIRKQIIQDNLSFINYEKSNQIIWWGNLSSVGISTLMRKTKALIMHSQFEAGGRVIIEALTSGVPVIATPFGFGKDYIFDGYNGFITEFNDIKKLAKCMMRFSEQPYLSSVMGNNAHSFMDEVYTSWDYFKKHQYIYDAFCRGNFNLISLKDFKLIPRNINSYKARNSVLCFPFFDTERTISELSNLLTEKIGKNVITQKFNDNFHSNIYSAKNDKDEYILKSFYHILTYGLLKLQYKNTNVIHAKEQIDKAIESAKFHNIADILLGDPANLFYVTPCYQLKDKIDSLEILISFWREAIPDNSLIRLYRDQKFIDLKKQISGSNSLMVNNLFCAEIACENIFRKYNQVPYSIKEKANQLIQDSKPVWGLNYGKGILGHVVECNGVYKLLPTHNFYLGELGCDIVLTYMQLHCDDVEIWKELKAKQNIVSSERLDVWLILAIYSNEQVNMYPKTLSYILNL